MTERLGNGLGDSNGVSLDFVTIPGYLSIPLKISKRERDILRGLALRIRELANRPIEEEKKSLWYRHNALEDTPPVIFCDPENGWYEILTAKIESENPLARLWEYRMRKEIFWGEQMKDDKVIEDSFYVHYLFSYGDYGVQHVMHEPDTLNGAVTWSYAIQDYQESLPKLHVRDINIEYEKTRQLYNLAEEAFGDILKVKYRSAFWWSFGLTWDLIYFRGLENMMIDMYDHPDELHQVMALLRDDALNRLDFFERNNLLTLNNGNAYVGSGGFGWSKELPSEDFDGMVKTKDMWGFCESQETLGISPEMFAEFIYPYQKPIMERFPLNCYGCCEPLNHRWEIIKDAPGLRRVSVSAWADVDLMAEMLGKNFIYSWKPRPADLALPVIDRDAIRAYIKKTHEAAKAHGCRLEIIMKDNHTIADNPQNVIDWVQIAREVTAE
jgi:hypothetical protein